MSEKEKKIKICVCTCDKKGRCGDRGGARLRKELKKRIQQDAVLCEKIKVKASECLGLCKKGVAVEIRPGRRRLLNLEEGDSEKLFRFIEDQYTRSQLCKHS